jgi:hypothetical protein
VASGDLNISHNEEVEARFFHDTFSKVADVSHLVGCKGCEGTHNYRTEWSFLDVMLFAKSMDQKGNGVYRLEPQSIQVVRDGNRPKRFDIKTKEGTSDHFPLYARIVKAAAPPATPLKN